MINVIEIKIEEFEDKIYDRYIKLFPEEEQRDWDSIRVIYNNKVERFYKIVDNNIIVGFFLLGKIPNHPYYLDYFAIYEEYQGKGYGSKAIRYLLDNIVKEDGLIGEIEKENPKDPLTIKRYEFYKRLGFIKIDSEYLLYGVNYTPIVHWNINDKKTIDNIFLVYYNTNCGIEEIKKNCKFLR